MDAPERIWIDTERLRFDSALRAVCDAEQFPDGSSSDVEYVRAAALAAKDAEIERLRARIAEKDAENSDLKSWVIAFGVPWADEYARANLGLPQGHLHAVHYDILEKCGARMVDFTRHDPVARKALEG